MSGTERTDRGWFTTAPHPKSSLSGFDAGQKGWRLHYVSTDGEETFVGIGKRSAACGLVPAHGWSLDLFIDEPCQRCMAALERRGTREYLTTQRGTRLFIGDLCRATHPATNRAASARIIDMIQGSGVERALIRFGDGRQTIVSRYRIQPRRTLLG